MIQKMLHMNHEDRQKLENYKNKSFDLEKKNRELQKTNRELEKNLEKSREFSRTIGQLETHSTQHGKNSIFFAEKVVILLDFLLLLNR